MLITHRAYNSVGTSYMAIEPEFSYEIEPHLTWRGGMGLRRDLSSYGSQKQC